MAYVLPVRDMVMFPGAIAPMFVGRPKSLKAIEMAILEDRKVFLTAQRDAAIEEPKTEDLYTTGTICNILQMMRIPDGSTKVLLEGLERMHVRAFSDDKEVLSADIVPVDTGTWKKDKKMEALKRSTLMAFEEYVNLHPKLPSEILIAINSIEDPAKMTDLMASHLIIDVEKKQNILECYHLSNRLEILLKVLLEENELLKLEHDIHDKVQQELEESQKQYYLREQLKVIKDELGQGDEDSEIAVLEKKITETNLPEEIDSKVRSELKKLSKMPSMSSEATVVRNYIDWILTIPWHQETVDNLDFARVKSVLDGNHYGLKKVKERLLEFLAVKKLAGKDARVQILCLAGPPGVGKTSLARSVAEAMGRKFVSMSLGGVRDEAEIRGHRKTYIGSMPGRIIQKIKQAGTVNPVLLMDEIDKVGSDFRGDPAAALLEVLDPEQNHNFTDHYLEVPYDLSKVLFITTANVVHTIPRALLDRMEVIQLSGYGQEEKLRIAKKHLFPKLLRESGLAKKDLSISDGAYKKIISDYTREAGVRNLERQIAKVCRKAALKVVEFGEEEKLPETLKINGRNLSDLLGAPRRYDVRLPKRPKRGVAIGLAWTEAGGEVLVIEVVITEGKGAVTLTGNLGKVMQESAQTAVGYLKSHAGHLGIKDLDWNSIDIHIHVPEGAIPKDGPSAGVTMAVAILSVVGNRQYNPSVAMTGEISLLGQVLPIGGVREKILAAKRNGMKKIIVPKSNKPDVDELDQWVKEDLEFIFASDVKEVFSNSLENYR